MSHIIELTLSLKVDGILYPNFPLIRRLQVDQLIPLGFTQRAGEGYTSLATQLTTLQAAIITTDQPLSFRVNNQSQSIPVNAGGLLCFFDTTIDIVTLLSVLNAGTENAQMNGLSGGSFT